MYVSAAARRFCGNIIIFPDHFVEPNRQGLQAFNTSGSEN